MREVKFPAKRFLEHLSDGLDSIIGVFSPRKEYQRKMYRFVNKVALRGGYSGANIDRLNNNWVPKGGSADEDLLPDLDRLRERSRDLNRNDSVASGITSTMLSNTIGTGISPQCRIDGETLGMTPEIVSKFQKQVESAWDKWSSYADAGNRMSFYEIQHLVERQILENGEGLIIPVMIDEPGRPYFLALNVIESDRMETPSDKRSDKSIRRGIEIGERGQPIAYWICKTHPGDITYNLRTPDSKQYIRYEAFNPYGRRNIFHLYHVKRPGQTRGEPFFSPVINRFKDLADYMEAELVAARVAACFAIFVKSEEAIAFASGASKETNAKGQRVESVEPGMIKYLLPGESVETANPNRPSAQFDPFVDKVLRFIGAGLGLPYELVIRDFSKTNYSSARAAILEARKFFQYRQQWSAGKYCQPTWEMLMDEVVLRGEVDAPNYFERRLDYTRAKWIAPGWGYIDPEAEINASLDAVSGNVSTLADECAVHGKDWEEVLEQRAREETKRKELGLDKIEGKKLVLSGMANNKGGANGQKNQ
jgi:lambda family phage portal protein